MSNKLFVGNLAWSVTSEKLLEVFSAFGQVIEAKVLIDHQNNRSRGFGFVTFANEEDANRATAEMQNKEIDGRAIRCDNSQQQSDRRERRPREDRGFKSRDDNGYRSRDDNHKPREDRDYASRDDNGYSSRDDRPRRDFHRDDNGYSSRDDRPRRDFHRDDNGYSSRDDRPRRDFHRDDNGYSSREDRPRRDFHRDDSRSRNNTYDNYNINAFPPDPDKMSRNNRRDNRKKDRNYDDDDRW